LQVAVKNQVQKVRQELLAGMSVKLLVIKQVAGPGLIFVGGDFYDG
jgi:hypothetical protein